MDSELVEPRGDSARFELHIGVRIDVTGGAVDDAGLGAQVVLVLEDIRMEREVFWDGDVGEFGAVNDVVWGCFYCHWKNKNENEMFQREEKMKTRKMDLSLIGASGKGMFIYKWD